jgi:hypothetical protein
MIMSAGRANSKLHGEWLRSCPYCRFHDGTVQDWVEGLRSGCARTRRHGPLPDEPGQQLGLGDPPHTDFSGIGNLDLPAPPPTRHACGHHAHPGPVPRVFLCVVAVIGWGDAMSSDGEPSLLQWRQLTSDERAEWAAKIVHLVDVDRMNRIIVVSGTCPLCRHGFTSTASNGGILLDGGLRAIDSADDWSGDVRFTVACHCQAEHPGRPPEISHGCGASGRLRDSL